MQGDIVSGVLLPLIQAFIMYAGGLLFVLTVRRLQSTARPI